MFQPEGEDMETKDLRIYDIAPDIFIEEVVGPCELDGADVFVHYCQYKTSGRIRGSAI